MVPLYIVGTSRNVGKTTTSLGVLHCLRRHGLRVGYIKPLGQHFGSVEGRALHDDARLVERGLNHLIVDVTMACTGMLVASENIFPGWRATVDGAPAELHAAYTVFRGVVVPAGRHQVEMRYRPLWLYAGALFSVLSVLLVAAIASMTSRVM